MPQPTRTPSPTPRPRRLRAAVALGLLVPAALLAGPTPALADCMAPPPLDEAVKTAEIVFVGTVVETSNRDTWASVTVEEVWRGPDQPASLVVRGGPGGNSATSVDRSFEAGVKYIFLPYVDPAAGLSDNSCTNTQPWAEAMAALRPDDARKPLGAGSPTAEPGVDLGWLVPILGVAGVVFLAMLGIGLLARGRQDA